MFVPALYWYCSSLPDYFSEPRQGHRPGFVIAHRVVNHGLQLPDISGKVIGCQQNIELSGCGGLLLSQLLCGGFQKMLYEKREIIIPLPKRRQVNMVGVESVKEILAKITRFNRFAQIPVGSDQNSGF